jgi:hypothetical protein
VAFAAAPGAGGAAQQLGSVAVVMFARATPEISLELFRSSSPPPPARPSQRK